MTNASFRIDRTRDPTELIEVFEAGDMGQLVMAPDGIMRVPIILGATYEFHKPIELPRLWLPSNADPTVVTDFRGTRPATISINGDDTPHIWGRDIATITLDFLQFVDTSNGGAGGGTRFLDIVGSGDFSFFVVEQSTWTNFKFMGTVTDASFIHTGPSLIFGANAGYVIRATPGRETNTLIGATRIDNLVSSPDTVAAAYSFIGGPPSAIVYASTLRQGKPPNSFIFVDTASTGSYLIFGNHYIAGAGFGLFFRADESLSLTQQADASILTSAVGFADSAVAPGVDTSVKFDAIVDVKRGDVHQISGELAYDGVHTVVRVAADLMSFDIAVVHSTSGQGTLDIVEHTVAVARFVEGETIAVAGTTNYNAAAIQVLRKTSDTTFTLPQLWVVDDAAGTASSSSKTQTDTGVITFSNTEQESSTVLGEACWNGNVSPTAITDGVYVPLVLTGVMLAPGEERVTLVDATTARLRNDSESPIRLSLAISLFSEKAGASPDDYRIAVSTNGAVPVFLSAPYAPLQLRDTNKQVTYFPTIQLDPGDEVQPMVAGDGSAVSVTFTDGQFIMRL